MPAAELVTTTSDLAVAIAAQPRRALVYAKELLRMSTEVAQAPGIERELDVLLTLLAERQQPGN